MKQMVNRILIIILGIILGCGINHSTSVVTQSNSSEVTLRVSLYGIKKKNFIDQTTVEALKRVLFRGVEGTKFNRPLVGQDEDRLLKEHSDYFNTLFSKRASSFVNMFVPQVVGKKDDTGKKIWIADVTVNVKALREDLEKHGIIRKFGL